MTRYRRDPRQMGEDEEAWFDEEEEEVTAIYTDPFTSSPTPPLHSLPVPTSSTSPPSTTSTTSTTSTSSSPHSPPTIRLDATLTSIPPSSTSSSSPSKSIPAPSPFTQVSYSPRPPAALNRAPQSESSSIKTPIVTQVLVMVASGRNRQAE